MILVKDGFAVFDREPTSIVTESNMILPSIFNLSNICTHLTANDGLLHLHA